MHQEPENETRTFFRINYSCILSCFPFLYLYICTEIFGYFVKFHVCTVECYHVVHAFIMTSELCLSRICVTTRNHDECKIQTNSNNEIHCNLTAYIFCFLDHTSMKPVKRSLSTLSLSSFLQQLFYCSFFHSIQTS